MHSTPQIHTYTPTDRSAKNHGELGRDVRCWETGLLLLCYLSITRSIVSPRLSRAAFLSCPRNRKLGLIQLYTPTKEREGQDLTCESPVSRPDGQAEDAHTYLGPRRFLPREISMGAEQQQQQQTAKAAGGSRFAAAFGLLRQYVKDQPGGGGGMATVGLMPGGGEGVEAMAPEQRIRTMELFPQQAGTIRDSPERMGPERAPLTIFYGGRTVVFDDFPAEKAKELMELAGSFGALPTASDAGAEPVCQNAPGQPCFADLPIARKASLHRFLEKRKSRLAAADPYPAPLAAPGAGAAKDTAGKAAPEDGGAPWLGVNSALQLN